MPFFCGMTPLGLVQFLALELGDQQRRGNHVDHIDGGQQGDRHLEAVAHGHSPHHHRPQTANAAAASQLAELKKAVLESGIDYHRVLTDEPYEQVLARFLVGRAVARGLR